MVTMVSLVICIRITVYLILPKHPKYLGERGARKGPKKNTGTNNKKS